MNPPLRFSLLLVAAFFGCAPGPADATEPAPKAGERKPVDPFDRTRNRIDQLLKARINPELLPSPLPNPFTLPVNLTALTEDDLGPAQPNAPAAPVAELLEPGSHAETLAAFAATPRISGAVTVDGKLNFIINQLLYKEGDTILMNKRDPKSAITISKIVPGALTLTFNEASQVIRLRN
jgi:hypothetical protein